MPFLRPKTETSQRPHSRGAGMSTPLFHVVLFQPEIPHNTGAVGRTCVAVGAKLWLVRPLGFRITDRHLKRSGLDYWQYLDWEAVDNWRQLLDRLPDRRFWFLTKTAAVSYAQVAYRPGDVFVFGSESRGLPTSLLESHRESLLRVPISGNVRSLNLSVSVGITLYEAWRQSGWRTAADAGEADSPV